MRPPSDEPPRPVFAGSVRVRSLRSIYGLSSSTKQAAVASAFAAAEAMVAGGRVLGHAADAGVGDADQDDRLDEAVAGEGVRGLARVPGAVDDVGRAAVEEVLAVVEVKDREAAARLGAIGLGEIDGDGAVVREKARMKIGQEAVARIIVQLVPRSIVVEVAGRHVLVFRVFRVFRIGVRGRVRFFG